MQIKTTLGKQKTDHDRLLFQGGEGWESGWLQSSGKIKYPCWWHSSDPRRGGGYTCDETSHHYMQRLSLPSHKKASTCETGETHVRNADQSMYYAKANFLVLITYCNYVRCHHWGRLGDRNTGPLCTIFWRGCRYMLRRKTYTLYHHFTPIISIGEGQKVWCHTAGKSVRKQVFTYTASKSIKWLICTSVENSVVKPIIITHAIASPMTQRFHLRIHAIDDLVRMCNHFPVSGYLCSTAGNSQRSETT